MKSLSTILTLLLAGCATLEADITKQGIIEYQGVHVGNNEHVAGYTTSAGSYQFIQETNIVPAIKGISFAIEYTTSFSENRSVILREIVVYPKQGLTNPTTGKTSFSSYLEHSTSGFDKTMMFYQLSEDWEVVEGEWVFKVQANGKEILSRTFNIKKPTSN